MKQLIFGLMVLAASSVYAEEKICTVKGMHCKGCAESVEGKVCDKEKFSTCDIKITDEKKEIGSVHLVTKDKASKIDEKVLGTQIEDAGYKLDNCKSAPASKQKG
jgi:hypothetical protein